MASAPARRALISVSDKSGIVAFARELSALGIEILSTGGTCRLLAEAGIPVIPVETYTGFPEMMDGRVKTLHPRIHGGILCVRDNPDHMQQADAAGIVPIDIVVINLYPFRETIAKPGVTLEDAVENIDIGGPAMVRSSAKNHRYVSILVDPVDYAGVLDELRADKATTQTTRNRLMVKAYQHTADYDAAIAAHFATVYQTA